VPSAAVKVKDCTLEKIFKVSFLPAASAEAAATARAQSRIAMMAPARERMGVM
jgi:hypothetical protein